MNMLLKDIRYALRQLCRSPGFTLTVVITLALGIGALTTVATWTNAVLFSPWPHVEAPRQLRFVSATVLGGQGYSLHYDQYGYVRDQGRSWQDSAAFAWAKVNLTAPDAPPQAIPVGMVSASYFSFLGLRPQAGHFFNPHADDRAFGVNDEVVLSDRLWRMQFAANPGIIGRTIEINRHIFTVVGVAPQEFSGIFGGMEENAWLPLEPRRSLRRSRSRSAQALRPAGGGPHAPRCLRRLCRGGTAHPGAQLCSPAARQQLQRLGPEP